MVWGESVLGALVMGNAGNRRAGSCTGPRAAPSGGGKAGAGCGLSDDEDMSGRYVGVGKQELEQRLGFIGPSLGTQPVKTVECFLNDRVLRECWKHNGVINIQLLIESD